MVWMSFVGWYSLHGNDVAKMQLVRLSLTDWDTQPVNGSDSLETVHLPLSKRYHEDTNDPV